mgnify:CR=1 FL=1
MKKNILYAQSGGVTPVDLRYTRSNESGRESGHWPWRHREREMLEHTVVREQAKSGIDCLTIDHGGGRRIVEGRICTKTVFQRIAGFNGYS